jgi:hypothetical protein
LAIGTNLTTEAIQLGNTGTTTTLRGSVTAPTLTVTGVTTTGLQTSIPTTFTYTTLPTFTSSQIGYNIKSVITANTNVAGTGVTGNPFSGTTFTLTPGVWLLNVQIRMQTTSSGTSGVTGMSLNHTLATPQTGYTNSYCNFKHQYSIAIQDYSMNNSCIIVNNTASNVLTPAYVFNYTTTTSLVYSTDTFLIVTRIT